MYCGEMAVFHEKFYERIASQISKEVAKEAKDMFVEALKKFLNRENSTIKIYVEKDDKLDFPQLLAKDEIHVARKNGRFDIFKVDENKIFKSALQHMTVGDRNRIVRWETDKKSHSAKCFFHVDRSFEQNIDILFGYLEEASTKIG